MRHVFTGPDAATKYQRAGQWILATIYASPKAIDWCEGFKVKIQKAAGEGINSAGGFLVPPELTQAIIDVREYYGAFRRRARLVPMATDTSSTARRIGGAAAFFTAENAAISEATTDWDKIDLSAKKIGSLVRIPSELEEDSIFDIVDTVANEIGHAFAQTEDDCGFNGDGTSKYGGMTGALTWALDGNHGKMKVTANHNTFVTLDTGDLGALISGVQASAVPNAAWFCSQTCFGTTFCRLAGSAGGGYMDTRPVDGIVTPHYLGFPVILTQKLPLSTASLSGKGMLVFGDLYRGAALGQRRAFTVARSPDRYLDQDQIAVRVTERFHALVHDVGDNSNAGSLAVLVGS